MFNLEALKFVNEVEKECEPIFAKLEDISLNLQCYRIVYQGVPYDIKDYDDFMMKHKTVKILGVSY